MAAGQRERAAESGGGAGRQRGVQCGLPQVACGPHGCACHRPHEVTHRASSVGLPLCYCILAGGPVIKMANLFYPDQLQDFCGQECSDLSGVSQSTNA